MYLILIAWLYVTLMMAVAEATSTVGTVLGGIITFVLYGLLPLSIVLYIFGTPARRRKIKAQERAEREAHIAAVQAAQQMNDAAGINEEKTAANGVEMAVASSAPEPSITPDAGGKTAAAAQSGLVAAEGKKL